MISVKDLVDEQILALKDICEFEPEVINAFRTALLSVTVKYCIDHNIITESNHVFANSYTTLNLEMMGKKGPENSNIIDNIEGRHTNQSTFPIDGVSQMSEIESIDEKMVRSNGINDVSGIKSIDKEMVRSNGVNDLSGIESIDEKTIIYNGVNDVSETELIDEKIVKYNSINNVNGIELIDEKMIRYNGVNYVSGIELIDETMIRYNGVNYVSGIELIDEKMIRYNGHQYIKKESPKPRNKAADVYDLSSLKNERLLVFDIEWTLSTQRIYQLSWAIIHENQIKDKCFHSLTVDLKKQPFLHRLNNNDNDQLDRLEFDARDKFLKVIDECDTIISHNLLTDLSMLEKNDYIRKEQIFERGKSFFCTMYGTRNIVKATDKNGRIKNPSLKELYEYLFGNDIPNDSRLHNADYDTEILCECVNSLKYITPIS